MLDFLYGEEYFYRFDSLKGAIARGEAVDVGRILLLDTLLPANFCARSESLANTVFASNLAIAAGSSTRHDFLD
jgi:hypothetical protein